MRECRRISPPADFPLSKIRNGVIIPSTLGVRRIFRPTCASRSESTLRSTPQKKRFCESLASFFSGKCPRCRCSTIPPLVSIRFEMESRRARVFSAREGTEVPIHVPLSFVLHRDDLRPRGPLGSCLRTPSSACGFAAKAVRQRSSRLPPFEGHPFFPMSRSVDTSTFRVYRHRSSSAAQCGNRSTRTA
jgi:hypothetical protein